MMMSSTMPTSGGAVKPLEKSGEIRSVSWWATTSIPRPCARSSSSAAKINEVLAEACKKMAEGEVLQLYYNGNPAMPEGDYIRSWSIRRRD